MPQAKSTVSAPVRRLPRTLAGSVPHVPTSERAQAIARYEAALELVHQGKYLKAREAFVSMLDSAPPDVAASIRSFINACLLQISKGTTTFASHEERYDYAISLLNEGLYEDARQQFEIILKENKSATYVFYGMAVLASMTGAGDICLEHLAEAIKHDAQHRIQARADSDFQDMADDPRFTELLYPEA